jgi:hypothetical protein
MNVRLLGFICNFQLIQIGCRGCVRTSSNAGSEISANFGQHDFGSKGRVDDMVNTSVEVFATVSNYNIIVRVYIFIVCHHKLKHVQQRDRELLYLTKPATSIGQQ